MSKAPSIPAATPPAAFLVSAAAALSLEARSESELAQDEVTDAASGYRQVRAARLMAVSVWLRTIAGTPGASLAAASQGSA